MDVTTLPPPDAFALFGRLGFSFFAFGALILLALAFSCYIKIVTVLGIIRVGLGYQGLPSAFVGGALAISLAFLVMFPTIQNAVTAMDRVGVAATDESRAAALKAGVGEWKGFLQRHTAKSEKLRFAKIARQLETKEVLEGTDISEDDERFTPFYDRWQVLAPAFLVGELKGAFVSGFSILLPLLLVDLLVANVLLAIGFDQVSPHLVSFPLKLLLFVMVDGWGLITGNLVSGYLQ